MLSGAAKPLIIAGGGVHYSDAVDVSPAFAERHGIPVVETLAGKATLVHDHPNYAGPVGVNGSAAANAVAEDADVVLAIGTRLQDFTTGSWALFKNPALRFVSINTARWDANKQHATPVIGDRWSRSNSSTRDRRLLRSDGVAWLRADQDRRVAQLSRLDQAASLVGGAVVWSVIQVINEVCDDDDYIVSAAGGLPGELVGGWRSKSVGSFDTEFGFSTMGYEIAGGLGAKMARPDTDVVAFVGDGSYLMMNSDIYSTVFTGHKVIFIICDNGGFASINNLQVNQGGVSFNNLLSTARHAEMTRVDFAKHAESLGAIAERVEHLDDLAAAFARAKAADRSYAIVITVKHDEWTGGGCWWEVGVPEVSERAEVLVARGVYEAESKHQRVGV